MHSENKSDPADSSLCSIWAFSDGRPGHFNQTRGMVEALKLKSGDVDVAWLEVRLRAGFLRKLMRWSLNRGFPSWGWIRLGYRFLTPLPDTPPSIIVSSGGNTMYCNAAAARYYGCPNFFSGSLRKLQPRNFTGTLLLETHPDCGKAGIIPMALAPTRISKSIVNQAADAWRNSNPPLKQPPPYWTLLVGGNGAGAVYEEKDWLQLARWANEISRTRSIHWLVATSRRTGSVGEKILKDQLQPVLGAASWYGETPGQQVIEPFLGLSDCVVCTEDSMSMLIESMASGRPTLSFSPERSNPEKDFLNYVQRCENNRRLARIRSEAIPTGQELTEILDQLTPFTVSPIETLAERMHPLLVAS